MESRYINRFRSLGERSASQIKNQDAAGNLTEKLTQAKGSIAAQYDNTKILLMTATEMVKGVDTHQQMMGTELVKNIPLPTADVLQHHGKQLGYVQLTMRFMQAGLIHFMEEVYNAQHRISQLEKTIEALAAFDSDIDMIGGIRNLSLDLTEDDDSNHNHPPSPPQSVTSKSSNETPARSVTDGRPVPKSEDKVDRQRSPTPAPKPKKTDVRKK